MWNKTTRRVVFVIVVFAFFVTFLNELRIVKLAYSIDTNQSTYADYDGIVHVAYNETPLTQLVISSIVRLKYQFGVLTESDVGLIQCYLNIGGEPAELLLVQFGTETLIEARQLQISGADSVELSKRRVLLTLIGNSLSLHYEMFRTDMPVSDGTSQFVADTNSFSYEDIFQISADNLDQAAADRQIAGYAAERLGEYRSIAANKYNLTNLHYLQVEAKALTSSAEKYISSTVERKIVRDAFDDFLRQARAREELNDHARRKNHE